MSFFDLFKRKVKNDSTKSNSENLNKEVIIEKDTNEIETISKEMIPKQVLEFFNNTKGGADIAKMIRKFDKKDIERLCSHLPIEDIDLSDGLSKDVNRFEAITCLSDILVRYDWTREQDPAAQLPKDYPSEKLANIIVPRIISYIKNQNNTDIGPINKNRLYEFAMALMNAKRYRDAIECLKISKPSLKGDDDFWLAACYFNIANLSKKKEDIAEAIKVIKPIKNSIKHLPAQAMDTLNKMLNMLETGQ